MTEDFKNRLIASMNKGGWGKENFTDAMPLINEHIEQLLIQRVSQRSELVCDKPSPVRCAKWQRFENGCLDCNMIREQTCG
tara:strand:+ start:1631 stop:1873 length:243 start_codon:yes stop_codon:yes gene_type:complete